MQDGSSSGFIFRAKRSFKKHGSTIKQYCRFFTPQYGDYSRYNHSYWRWDSCFFITRLVSRQERRKHAQDLSEHVYKRLCEFRIDNRKNHIFVLTVPCDCDKFRLYKQLFFIDRGLKEPPFIEVGRLEYLDSAIQHLKHYRKMYKYWQEAQDLLRKHNENPTNVDEHRDNILRALNQFSKELAILVSDIKAGGILKGKCRIGY